MLTGDVPLCLCLSAPLFRSSRDVSREPDRRRDRGHSRDRSRDRKRSRSRDRRRSRSRSRDRRHRHDRSRSRDRRRRSSRSPSSHARDVFSDLPGGGGRSYHSSSAAAGRARARSPSPEVSLEALRRKEREEAVAQGKDYARRPSSYKNSLSMSLISGTARRRSRSVAALLVCTAARCPPLAQSPGQCSTCSARRGPCGPRCVATCCHHHLALLFLTVPSCVHSLFYLRL